MAAATGGLKLAVEKGIGVATYPDRIARSEFAHGKDVAKRFSAAARKKRINEVYH